MPSTRRDQTHEHNRDEIKAVAWQQLAEVGAQALSLGAIARALGLTTPALYRYFDSRDALLTELIRDAYLLFTEALRSSLEPIPPANHAERFRAMCLAYYSWAISHSQQYLLMFATPIPGFAMDVSTGEAADQSFLTVLEVIHAADRDGKIEFPTTDFHLSPPLTAQLQSVKHLQTVYSEKVTYLALISWSFIHGITTLELCQRYSVILAGHTRDFVELEIDRFIQTIGFK